MPVRSSAMLPSTASRVIIRVEKYSADRMAGLLYNPYLDVIERFRDIMDLTNKLDAMFDSISFPQANMSYRSFQLPGKPKKPGPAATGAPVPGDTPASARPAQQLTEQIRRLDKDVFLVHVQFRQNASWQGTIKWAGQEEELRFRSTLEMLKIMDAALQQNHPEVAPPETL